MASLSTDPDGTRRILWVGADGKRKTITLGEMEEDEAITFNMHVGYLIDVQRLVGKGINGSPSPATQSWLASLGDIMHGRIAKAGLVKPRRSNMGTLQELVDAYFESLNVKPITSLGYKPTSKSLLKYFGASTPLSDIDPLKADQWRAKMKKDGLAEATISKRVKLARTIFRHAVRWKMIAENPFTEVKAGSQKNKARQRFISQADSAKVLEACPDAQWRLLFALSRYGGLRCPSEHLALTWADVNWAAGRFRVRSSKTEHHDGHEERWVPIFPELRPHLLAAFEEAEPGTKYMVTRYRNRNSNLRTQLQRIIRRAGLTPWPRLFHNLRATRQTELAERFPAHVVCKWIGNSERVAADHYLQTLDAHFEKAVGATQIPTQNDAETPGTTRKAVSSESLETLEFPSDSESRLTLPTHIIAATGLEPVTRGL